MGKNLIANNKKILRPQFDLSDASQGPISLSAVMSLIDGIKLNIEYCSSNS
jgi:hypothetical protein